MNPCDEYGAKTLLYLDKALTGPELEEFRSHIKARPMLRRLLHEAPTAEIIAAVAAIADPDLVVELGRTARMHPDLIAPARAALEDIEDSRAGAVLTTLPGRPANSLPD